MEDVIAQQSKMMEAKLKNVGKKKALIKKEK